MSKVCTPQAKAKTLTGCKRGGGVCTECTVIPCGGKIPCNQCTVPHCTFPPPKCDLENEPEEDV